ncbi:MAG TPA: histidine kinase [Steroidobacter sp.]|nr:histidine kinase [Steroidobacter sp.]
MSTVISTDRDSILGRLGIAMGAIVVLAMISILVSTIFTEMSAGQARAINLAGSLRMLSYRLSGELVQGDVAAARRSIDTLQSRLNDPALRAGVQVELAHPLRATYMDVSTAWREEVEPLARQAMSDRWAHAAFLVRANDFVAQVDDLVELLELELESKISWLRWVQGVSLLLIVVVVLATMYIMHTQVVVPLSDLLHCASAVRRGNFKVAVAHDGADELGQLGQAFNTMVNDLSRMYAELEARVAEKTEELARSNQSLELLYSVSCTLSGHEIDDEALNQVLREVRGVVEAPAGAICATEPPQRTCFLLAADTPTGARPHICNLTDCERCIGDGQLRVQSIAGVEGEANIVSVPLVDGGRSYGVMPLELPKGRTLTPWQSQLLATVGNHIGAALALARRHQERHRLALLEERTIIARELHDSLAQSLSYQKIQVTRLESLLDKQAPREQIEPVVKELKTGLSNAYRQLRELLTTFRLRMDGRGLASALEETVREFEDRGGIEISLHNHLIGVELAANEEIHVLQLIREALSNVVHHARARRAVVSLEHAGDNQIRVRIDDDGIGIPEVETAAAVHHYGIVIMRDRAATLQGRLRVGRREAGGTRVELEFTPETPFQSERSVAV